MPLKFYSTCSNTHAHVHHTPTCSEFHCMLSILERQLHVCHVLRRKIKSILYLLSPWIQKYMLSPTLPSCIWHYIVLVLFLYCVQLYMALYCPGIISMTVSSYVRHYIVLVLFLFKLFHFYVWYINWCGTYSGDCITSICLLPVQMLFTCWSWHFHYRPSYNRSYMYTSIHCYQGCQDSIQTKD